MTHSQHPRYQRTTTMMTTVMTMKSTSTFAAAAGTTSGGVSSSSFFLLTSSLFLLLLSPLIQPTEANSSRELTVTNNHPSSPAGVYWVDINTGGLVELGDAIEPTRQSGFNSFVGHEFEVHELPNAATGMCGDGNTLECKSMRFKVNPDADQLILITPEFELDHTTMIEYRSRTGNEPAFVEVTPLEEPSKIRDSITDVPIPMSECQQRAKTQLLEHLMSANTRDAARSTLDDLVSCLETNTTRMLQDANNDITYEGASRDLISGYFENYTCADESYPTTTPIAYETWTHRDRKTIDGERPDEVAREVHVLLNRTASKVHLVRNFISDEECEAMERAAKPKLHRATVADGKGGSEVSKNRKAMQAGIKVHWEEESNGDHIAVLSRRVYDYVNHVTGLGIEEHGQEDLMSIQYFGRGDSDVEPDRYTPHCDGDCTGMRHKNGTRVATMVMYCTIPDRGGATNFKNSALHVKPRKGNAIFFSYVDPEKMVMDKGFTEHSGCPVLEGEKKIVTQWVRYGVDAENPWDSFNTLGIKRSEE